MPKVKTSRAAAKRFKTTGTGKLVRKSYLTCNFCKVELRPTDQGGK